MEQVLWTLFYLDDLDADFARFYRREWWQHSGPQFFARAERLVTYDGALTATVRREMERGDPDPDDPPDVLDMLADPAYAGMVEVG